MSILKEILNRWNADSPIFFKKIQTLGLSLSGFAGALLAIPTLPSNIHQIAGYVLTVGAVLAATSKLTVTDTSTLEKIKEAG